MEGWGHRNDDAEKSRLLSKANEGIQLTYCNLRSQYMELRWECHEAEAEIKQKVVLADAEASIQLCLQGSKFDVCLRLCLEFAKDQRTHELNNILTRKL